MPHGTLLSIDDDESQHRIIEFALKEADIPVQLCRVPDGDQALSFLQNKVGYELAPRPDLILLDLNLPKKNGFEVLKDIRASDSLRYIPVIMFTSFSLVTEKKKALALGAEDYIWKPINMDELIQTLRSVCHRFLPEG